MSASDDSKSVGQGLRRGLTNYGDHDFSLFLRKAFIKGAGFSDNALERRSSASSTRSARTIPATEMRRN